MKKLTMPVLLIAGAKDALFDSAKTIARVKNILPQAQTVFLLGAGHGLINQKERILKFLNS